jgi:translation initiation factor IF-3
MAIKFRDYNNRDAVKKPEGEHRINRQIFAREFRLIGAEGESLGVMSFHDAFYRAEVLDLDLVEISPTAKPPVCKIMDYGKFLYEKKRKEKENKKNSKVTKMKEITMRPVIDEHDYQTKLKNARGFLEKGDKVKVMLKMRGRELQHASENVNVIKRFIDDLIDVAKVEQNLKQDRGLAMAILQPKEVVVQKSSSISLSDNVKKDLQNEEKSEK